MASSSPALGETVRIYFGMRRGGSEYYGLDVTDRNAPTLLFKIGPNEAGTKRLTNAGQSWSTPAVARVNISGGRRRTPCKQVLVFGGGYDTVQDNGGLRDRQRRQPDLHGGCRERQRALVRRPVDGYRAPTCGMPR